MESSLPILLVSAKDQAAATTIISEIVHNKSEYSENNQIEKNILDCIWRISNKYYEADVRVYALIDGDTLGPQLGGFVEAHLIYLTQVECQGEAAVHIVQRRAEAGEGANVRLVAADASAEPPGLAGACARARLELVALREADSLDAPDSHDAHDALDAPDTDDALDAHDERGVERMRAALHAHLWPGLQRHGPSDQHVPSREAPMTNLREPSGEEVDSSDEEWSEWCAGPAASEEAFFAALSTLPGAAAAARQAAGSREERLARAEQLVAAFCHALGTPFD